MSFSRFAFALVAAGVVFSFAGAAGAAELPKDANTTCPVMMKEEVDPDLFVDFKGERIFLCCQKCKKRFNQDPEKYVARVKAAKAQKPAAAPAATAAPAAAAAPAKSPVQTVR